MFLLRQHHSSSPSSSPSSNNNNKLNSSSSTPPQPTSSNLFLDFNTTSDTDTDDPTHQLLCDISDYDYIKIVNFRRLFEHIKSGLTNYNNSQQTSSSSGGDSQQQLQKLLIYCSDAKQLLHTIEPSFIKAFGVDALNQIEEEFLLISSRIQHLSNNKPFSSSNSSSEQPPLPSPSSSNNIQQIIKKLQLHLIEHSDQQLSLLDEYGQLSSNNNNDDDDIDENRNDLQLQEQQQTEKELSSLTSQLKEKAQQVNEFIRMDVESIKKKGLILEQSKTSISKASLELNEQIDRAKQYMFKQWMLIGVVGIVFIGMMLLITIVPKIF